MHVLYQHRYACNIYISTYRLPLNLFVTEKNMYLFLFLKRATSKQKDDDKMARETRRWRWIANEGSSVDKKKRDFRSCMEEQGKRCDRVCKSFRRRSRFVNGPYHEIHLRESIFVLWRHRPSTCTTFVSFRIDRFCLDISFTTAMSGRGIIILWYPGIQ